MNPSIRDDLFPTFFTTFILFGQEVKGSFFFDFTNGHAGSCISSIYIDRWIDL